MAPQGRAAVGHQAEARPHPTSRSTHLRQCGADDNQIDQDELFDCHVNSADQPLPSTAGADRQGRNIQRAVAGTGVNRAAAAKTAIMHRALRTTVHALWVIPATTKDPSAMLPLVKA